MTYSKMATLSQSWSQGTCGCGVTRVLLGGQKLIVRRKEEMKNLPQEGPVNSDPHLLAPGAGTDPKTGGENHIPALR